MNERQIERLIASMERNNELLQRRTRQEESYISESAGGSVATGGWGQSGTLQAGNNDINISMQALFNKVSIYTVQFAAVYPPSPLAILQAEAEINWAVAGQVCTRLITMRSGISLTGNCEGVRVRVRDVSNVNNGGLNTPYDITMTVAEGGRPGTLLPATYQPPQNGGVGQLAANGIAYIPIIQNTGAIAVHVQVGDVTSSALPDLGIDVAQISADGVLQSAYDPRDYTWAVLAPSATQIRVRNNTPGVINYSVTFGIDG